MGRIAATITLSALKRFCLRTLDTAQRQQELIKTSESGTSPNTGYSGMGQETGMAKPETP